MRCAVQGERVLGSTLGLEDEEFMIVNIQEDSERDHATLVYEEKSEELAQIGVRKMQ